MDILHQMDQMKAMLRDFAPVLASYKKELKKAGFNDAQAFQLAKEYQRWIFEKKK